MGKRLLIFGPPGAGKGTHAKRLAADLGIPHVATGELLRQAIGQGTEAGRRADEYIRRGELVPDELVESLLAERLARSDAREGYLLDGFPRTVSQARALQELLGHGAGRVDGVLCLEAPEETLVKRIAGRTTCTRCQAVYNRFFHPPQEAGVCDACGAALAARTDDREDAVRRRLAEYRSKTSAVLELFRGLRWPIVSVASTGEVGEVYGRIRAAMGA